VGGHDQIGGGHRGQRAQTDRRALPAGIGTEPAAHQPAAAPDLPAAAQHMQGAFAGPGAGAVVAENDREVEPDGSGHLVGHVPGQPVAGHRPEADRREDRDAAPAGLSVGGQRGGGDRDLVGDVEVVHAGVQAGPQHRGRRGAERTGRQQDQAGVTDEPAHVSRRSGDPRHIEPLGEATQPIRVTPGQRRTVPPRDRLLRDQRPGPPGRSVQKP
jgi:hypothetical protein